MESALRNRSKQFVIDGEAVLLGVDGISDSMAYTRAGMTMRSSSMLSITNIFVSTPAVPQNLQKF
jgi:hypothetical protein